MATNENVPSDMDKLISQASKIIQNKMPVAREEMAKQDSRLAALENTDLNNLAIKALIGGLMGGGVGAAATGEVPGETREQKRKRLIRNALLGTVSGAGLGGLSEVKMGSTFKKIAFAESLKNIDLTNPTLLAGLGSAGAAGLLTALSKKKKKESLGKKTLDVLGNAALAGALGAGSAELFRQSKRQFTEALPATDVDPATEALRSPVAALLSGGVGAGVGAKFTKNIQDARAVQELKNYASGLSGRGASGAEKNLAKKLNQMLSSGDIGQAKAELSNLFGTSSDLTSNLGRFGGKFRTEEDLRKFLRYLNINTPSAASGIKGMGLNTLNTLKGTLERGLDLRNVQGIGGRGAPIRGTLLGLAAGAAVPYLLTKGNEYLQNRQ